MPPTFALQNVLDIRHSKVEAIEIQLGRTQKQLLSLQDRKTALLDMKDRHLQEMYIRMQDEINVFQLDILRSNVSTIDNSTKQIDADINETQKKISQIRVNLVTAKQDEETLEILKEKEIEKFKEEIKRIENKQQDDVYISLAYKNHQQEA
ncbi:MAG: flagellar FliJ family protein [Anaerolineaceae bacterium]